MVYKLNLKKFDNLSANQWEERIFHRGVNIKFPHQLKTLIDEMYPEKIERLDGQLQKYKDVNINKISSVVDLIGLSVIERLEEQGLSIKDFIDEQADFLNEKIVRLTDKFATCNKMYDLRISNAVKDSKEYKMHGTLYYIDLAAGDDAANGLATGTPWLTIGKYTTTTVRTAGDIAYVRANTSQVIGANVIFDEDGTTDSYISIIGCDSVVNDPWNDASDVRPIFDMNGSNYYFLVSSDNYWGFKNLHFHDCHYATFGALTINASIAQIIGCKFDENDGGIDLYSGPYCLIQDCIFNNNFMGIEIVEDADFLYPIKNCTFDGNGGTCYGILSNYTGVLNIIDCVFSAITALTADIYGSNGTLTINTRNTDFNVGIGGSTSSGIINSFLYNFDDNGQVFEAQHSENHMLKLDRVTDVVNAGGADSSLKALVLQTNTSVNIPASCALNNPSGLFKIWLAASVEKTITIYIRGYGWSTSPTAAQLHLKAEYLSNGASAARTSILSTEVIDENDNFHAFNVTMTPARDGFVYLDVIIAKYEAASGIYIDLKPVIS